MRREFRRFPAGFLGYLLASAFVVALVVATALPSEGKKKDAMPWGEGLIVNVPLPEAEVLQVVGEIAANGIIRGTREYNRDDFVTGAKAANTSKVFGQWKEGGEVIYKVREEALDPRNFKNSGDLGTLAVRYVIKAQGAKNTVLRIDAIFQEEIRHTVHQSNGSVESAEYRDIQDHLDFVELMKKQDAEAERERQQRLARKQNPAAQTAASQSSSSYRPSLNTPPAADNSDQAAAPASEAESSTPSQAEVAANSPPSGVPQPQPPENAATVPPAAPSNVPAAATAQPPTETAPQPPTPSTAPDSTPTTQPVTTTSPPGAQPDAGSSSNASNASLRSDQNLKQHVEDLRRQIERVVKSPGAPLKSAPFHTAGTLQSLPTGTEVLIVISTPYWYGVETHDGQHGWMMRDELEQKR